MSAVEVDGTIDHTAIDWTRIVGARYAIDQSLRYVYDTPIRNLRHKLIIAPRKQHGDQQRIDHRIWSSTRVPLTESVDAYGNDVASLSISRVAREITFGLASTIVRVADATAPSAATDEFSDPRWMDGGRLTRPDALLLDAAADLRSRYPDPSECAHEVMRFVYRHMTYTKNVTDVFTTAATAFHMGRGVCQDFSHIAIALARACGFGARYASGHLLGEGATHAWVEFLIPTTTGSRVLSLDPTYGSPTDFRYLVVAIGRDYDDVPPTSGVFSGRSSGTLFGQQRVRLTQLTYAA